MKSLFNRFSSTAPSSKSNAEGVQDQLQKTQTCLQNLRTTEKENFPLLNEATRYVQQLDALVGRLADGNLKQVWVEQLTEVRNELAAATEKQIQLSNSKAAAQSQSGPTGGLFDGLEFGAAPEGDADLVRVDQPPASAPAKDVFGSPLDEDLFSSLSTLEVTPASAAAAQKLSSGILPDVETAAGSQPRSQAEDNTPPSNPGDPKRKRRTARKLGTAREAQPGNLVHASPARHSKPQAAGEAEVGIIEEVRGLPLPSIPALDVMAPEPSSVASPSLLDGLDVPQHSPAEPAKPSVEEEVGVEERLRRAGQAEQAAKLSRRQAIAKIADLNGALQQLQATEAEAVEREDFEAAADLSAQSDSARQDIQAAEQAVLAAELAIQTAMEERWSLSRQRVEQLREAAKKAAEQAKECRASFEAARDEADQILAQAKGAREAAKEKLSAQEAGLSERQSSHQAEQSGLDSEMAVARQPASESRQEQTSVVSRLQEEVDKLRSELAAKEAHLAEAEAELAARDVSMQSIDKQFEAAAAKMAEQRLSLEDEASQIQAEKEAAEQKEAELLGLAEATRSKAEALQATADQTSETAQSLAAKASSLASMLDGEEAAIARQNRLRGDHGQALSRLEEAKAGLAKSQAAVKSLSVEKGGLRSRASKAEEESAAIMRKLPQLEADKKAAALAKDFKEAARLSAEAKKAVLEAEDSREVAARLAKQATALEGEEQAASLEVRDRLALVEEAGLALVRARFQLLQAIVEDCAAQLEAASAAGSDTGFLSEELDDATAELALLKSSHDVRSLQEPSKHSSSLTPLDTAVGQPSQPEESGGEQGQLSEQGPLLELQPVVEPATPGAGTPEAEVAAASPIPRWTIDKVPSPTHQGRKLEPAALTNGGASQGPGLRDLILPSEVSLQDSAPLRDAPVPEGFPTLISRSSGTAASFDDEDVAAGDFVFPHLGPRMSVGHLPLDQEASTSGPSKQKQEEAVRSPSQSEEETSLISSLVDDSAPGSKNEEDPKGSSIEESKAAGEVDAGKLMDDMFAGLSFG